MTDTTQEREAREKVIRGDYTGAEKIYRTLRVENSSDLTPIIGLADVYLKQNNSQKALVLMELEENRFSDDPFFYRHFCRAYRAVGDRNNAFKSIEKAVLLDPGNPEWIASLGFTYWFFSDPERAINETEKALKLVLKKRDPLTLIMIKNNLAYYYAEAGKKENRAREYATFCYQNRMQEGMDQLKRSLYVDTYGYVKMKFTKDIGELDEAIAIFNKVIKDGAPIEFTIGHLEEAYQKRRQLERKTRLS